MRELKFRVYIPDHEKFCYFDLGNFDYSDRYLHQHSYPVQQYTGLKDCSGKDIYEGDIVSGICLNDGPQICVVGFDTFGIFYTKIKFYPCEEWDNVAMLAQEHNEVIGNIFENSEFLNQ